MLQIQGDLFGITHLPHFFIDKIAIQERDRARTRDTDERLKANKVYREKHKKEIQERSRVFARRRRVLKKLNGYEDYTENQVLVAYGETCYLCDNPIDLSAPRSTHIEGWQKGLHIDHVTPISKGGSDTLENVRPTHAICNTKKGSKMLEDFKDNLDPSLFEDKDVELDDYNDHA
jgi:5-methylcytosine-specific restriction endonuclease McrA